MSKPVMPLPPQKTSTMSKTSRMGVYRKRDPLEQKKQRNLSHWSWADLSPAEDWTPERIKALRLSLRMTQPQFAQMLGTKHFMSVVHYESGVRHPSGVVRKMLNIVEHYAKRVERARKKREAERIKRREEVGLLPLRNGRLYA